MYKQSPSRNYRSKGIKVKHILQICLLLAVCFWLIYQVKHSHDKKREFDEKGVKISSETQSEGDVIKFGRKDLPRVGDATIEERTHEDDKEGNEMEDDNNKREMDDNNHEEEQEREDNRVDEKGKEEDPSRGSDDDEIDEQEPDKTEDEGEVEREEDILDEAKEAEEETGEKGEENEETGEKREENEETGEKGEENEETGEKREENEETGVKGEENEEVGTEDHADKENETEDRDHDEAIRNTHEAREEHYRADDASSEVAHDTPIIIPETENVTIDHGNGVLEQNTSRKENTGNTSDLEVKAEVGEDGSLLKSTYTEEKNNLTRMDEMSVKNSTILIGLSDKPEDGKNATVVLSTKDSVPFASNGTQVTSVAQNITVSVTTNDTNSDSLVMMLSKSGSVSDKIQTDSLVTSNNAENININSVESLPIFGVSNLMKLENTNSSESSNTSAETEDNPQNLRNDVGIKEEISENSGDSEAEQNPNIHLENDNGNGDSHDPIDASDSGLNQEEKESRTYLNTLPEITTGAHATEDAAAE